MGMILTITRNAKCKDCEKISLLHYGKRKKYICDLGLGLHKGKESKICREDYVPRLEYHIKNIYKNTDHECSE